MKLKEAKRGAIRKRIAAWAKELFAAKSYAEACEISRSALYKYFESKQAFAAKVVVDFHTEMRERVTSVMYDQVDAVEPLSKGL